jgi:hypothetical protein
MKAFACILLCFISLPFLIFSQDTIEKDKRAEMGVILSIMGHQPLDMNVYNKDYNLVQTNIATEGGAFYRKYLGNMFDIQLEIVSGNRYMNVSDSLSNFRLTDLYYALNVLPVLKFRDDDNSGKNVQFHVIGGASLNFLANRKFAFPQSIQPQYNSLKFGDVITLAYTGDFGIKYNFSRDNSFLVGMRGSRDLIVLHSETRDNLEIKYWNYGLYVGFAGKVRKR